MDLFLQCDMFHDVMRKASDYSRKLFLYLNVGHTYGILQNKLSFYPNKIHTLNADISTHLFVEAISITEFARLIIALNLLTFVCHISVRYIVMFCDDPMAFYAAKQHSHLCNQHSTHPVCVRNCRY